MSSEFDDAYARWMEGSDERDIPAMFEERIRVLLGRRELQIIAPEASVREAVERMSAQHIGCMLVGDAKRLVGVFTERDVLKLVASDPHLLDRPVGDVMTPNPECLPGDARVVHALNTMVNGGFRHIPVLDRWGKPVGVLSMRDCMQLVVEYFPDAVLNAAPFGHEFAVHREGA